MENLFTRRALCQIAGAAVAAVAAPTTDRLEATAKKTAAKPQAAAAAPGPDKQKVRKAAAAASGLAPSVVSVWHSGWKGPQPWTGYPAAVRSRVNHVVLAIAQSSQAGTGRLFYFNRFGANLASSIRSARASGTNVLMGVGGSGAGGTITITNATQADQAFDSIATFVKDYGINGIDLDLEPTWSHWTQEALVRLCTRLKAAYGPKFLVGLTVALYEEHTARWLGLAKALGSSYDYMAPMLYDFPEANLPNFPAVCVDKCDVMAGGGVPASKMILGFKVENVTNASATWEQTRDAYRACVAKYPSLRGAFGWQDETMAKRNWDWALGLGPRIRAAKG